MSRNRATTPPAIVFAASGEILIHSDVMPARRAAKRKSHVYFALTAAERRKARATLDAILSNVPLEVFARTTPAPRARKRP